MTKSHHLKSRLTAIVFLLLSAAWIFPAPSLPAITSENNKIDAGKAKNASSIPGVGFPSVLESTVAELETHFRENGPLIELLRRNADFYRAHLSEIKSEDGLKENLRALISKLNIVPMIRLYNHHDQMFWIARSLATGRDDSPGKIGALFERRGDRWFVSHVFPKSEASSAALQRGDEILGAGDRPFDPVYSFGSPSGGRPVKLVWRRDPWSQPRVAEPNPVNESYEKILFSAQENSFLSFNLEGKRIFYYHVWSLRDKKWILGLTDFAAKAQKSADVFVLDLRDGYDDGFDHSERLEGIFIKDKKTSDGRDSIYTKPLVLIVNQNTAGNKEKLAHMIRNTKRAPLVGVSTKGCFLKRNHIFYAGGEWLLAVPDLDPDKQAGYREGVGIEPEVFVKDVLVYAGGEDLLFNKAMEVAKSL
ncbi:MAG: hypothetical protein HQK54_05830 [Oligoflexales bacterium]|nr:hypothetical protein [Oligoflexales bacterium]